MTQLFKFACLTILVLLSLPHVSPALDPSFQACEPKKCGDLTISYPFFIENQQESFCGYPGYQVTCDTNNHTIINLSNDSYAITEIDNFNQTLTVINGIFLPAHHNCSLDFHNFTLDKSRFQFASKPSQVFLLQNCSKEGQNSLRQSTEFACNRSYGNKKVLAAYADDVNLGSLAGQCEYVISVPFEGQGSSDLENVVEQGIQLHWTAPTCSSECLNSGGRCILSPTSQQAQCFCTSGPSAACRTSRNKSIIIESVTAASAAGIVLLIALIICTQRRRSINKSTFPWTKGTIENQNVEAFLESYGSLVPKRYTYQDIKKMTNSFKERLGEGGYGHVYKGKLHDGRSVAVKVLKKLKGKGEDFINEVVSITRTNHVNVVTLLGFCFEGKRRALVYEFLPNGSLEKFIHGASNGQSLPCETLLNIAIGIAKGLDYLHRGCNTRILHLDIKPHNILLDERFQPKISDFGLARLFPKEQSHISTLEARGTIGYIAPEVFCRNFGGVSHKSDVYSFGMMIIDVVCGRTDTSAQVQNSSDLYFPQWIYNQLEVVQETAPPGIMDNEEKKMSMKMLLVGLWCIQTLPSNRPSMNEVVEMLEGSIESLQMPPKPDMSSPLTSVFDTSSKTQSTT